MRNKKIFALIGVLFFAGIIGCGAAIGLNNDLSNVAATGLHNASCQWNHYDEVLPTETSHGSKQFWACCTHHDFVLVEPEEGSVQDMGAFSGAYFDELESSDSRYIAPLSELTHYVKIGNGEPIPMTNISDILTPEDTCSIRFNVTGLNLNHGDIITFYRNGTKLTGVGVEIGSNVVLRTTLNNLGVYNLFVQSPGESLSIDLNIYEDGSMKVWGSGCTDNYFQCLCLVRGGVYYYIDFNLRLNESFVEQTPGLYVPKGYLQIHFLEGDQFIFGRSAWWISYVKSGDSWRNTTKEGQLNSDLLVITRAGYYYLAFEDCNKGGTWFFSDRVVFTSYDKDFFINDYAISRSNFVYEGDQVRVVVQLNVGDVVYMKRYLYDLVSTIGWNNIDGASPSKSCFNTNEKYYLVTKTAGTYYFASWNASLYVEKL